MRNIYFCKRSALDDVAAIFRRLLRNRLTTETLFYAIESLIFRCITLRERLLRSLSYSFFDLGIERYGSGQVHRQRANNFLQKILFPVPKIRKDTEMLLFSLSSHLELHLTYCRAHTVTSKNGDSSCGKK